jgi:hypothetical protein
MVEAGIFETGIFGTPAAMADDTRRAMQRRPRTHARAVPGVAPDPSPGRPQVRATRPPRPAAGVPAGSTPARRGAPLGRRECTVERSCGSHPAVQGAERAAARRSHRRAMRARRSALVGVFAVLLATCAVWVQGGGGRTGSGPLAAPGAGRTEAVAARLWVVQPGDTLWASPTTSSRPATSARSSTR